MSKWRCNANTNSYNNSASLPACRTQVYSLHVFEQSFREWRARARTKTPAGIIMEFHQLPYWCGCLLFLFDFQVHLTMEFQRLDKWTWVFKVVPPVRARTTTLYYTTPNMLNDISHLLNQVGGNTHSQKSESLLLHIGRCEPSTLLWGTRRIREKKNNGIKWRKKNRHARSITVNLDCQRW